VCTDFIFSSTENGFQDDWVKKCMEYEVEGSRPREDQRGPGKRLFETTVKHVS